VFIVSWVVNPTLQLCLEFLKTLRSTVHSSILGNVVQRVKKTLSKELYGPPACASSFLIYLEVSTIGSFAKFGRR
jgi:hypothetical protein